MSTPAPPTPPSSTRPRREIVAWRNAVFTIFFLSGLSLASWVARLPRVREDVGLSLDDLGFTILAGSAGSIIGLISATPLLARFGARRGMILALVVVAAGLSLVGFGSTVVAAVIVVGAGLALFGFGNGAVDVMMNVEAAAAERELGRTVMPLMHAFFSVGTVVGALLAAASSALDIPVLAHLLVIAVLIAATVVVAVRFVPPRRSLGDTSPTPVTTASDAGSAMPADTPQTARTTSTARAATDPAAPRRWTARLRRNLAVWRDLRLLMIGVIMLGMSFAEGSANDWLAIAVSDDVGGHGLDNTTGALVFGVFVTAMTASRVAGGPMLDRFGRVRVLRVSAAIGVTGLALFIFADAFWLVVLGTVLWGLGCALGFPVGMSAAADDRENSAARVSAVAIIGYLAFLSGPPLIGVLGERFGILNALLAILALMVVAGIAAPAARERDEPVNSAPHTG